MFAKGKRAGNEDFGLVWLGNENATARLGLAVSRRVSPRAVARNRIKRIVRERFRHRLDEFPPIDIVVVARQPAAQRSRAELARSFDSLLERVIKKCATR